MRTSMGWRRFACAISTLILALGCGLMAASARGDGDPASDVLVSSSLYLPQDAESTPQQQAELVSLLSAARRSGYQLRVAVIASRSDLGSVTALWGQPQSYARFLGQELSLVNRGPLLVLMPGGYGHYRLPPASVTALSGLSAPGRGLAGAAIGSVRRLAAASGHPLPAPATGSSTSAGGSDVGSWLVFAVGALIIAAAWGASLRARPLRLGRGSS